MSEKLWVDCIQNSCCYKVIQYTLATGSAKSKQQQGTGPIL